MTDADGERAGSPGPVERADRLAAENQAVRQHLAELQQEKGERDRQIELLTRRLTEATRGLGDLGRQVAEEALKTEHAEWQAEVMRRRRWWRLGEALTALRRKPLATQSYRRVRRALAAKEIPAEPAAEPVVPRRPELTINELETLDFPAAAFPTGPVVRGDVTAAVVASPETTAALRYEWRQIDGLGADDWRRSLEAQPPGLLLVESAEIDLPLAELVDWCRERGIPTVYWDTGDGTAEAAEPFDHVFAVDEAAAARHVDAGLLPFAAQPRLHNPIRGADHGRFPLVYEGSYDERDEPLLAPAPKLGAHFFGDGFPSIYRQRVAPPLPYDKALTARKRYRVLLAGDERQVYEAAAAGVPVVRTSEAEGRDVPWRAGAVAEAPGVGLGPGGPLGPVVTDDVEGRAVLRALLLGNELRDRQAHLALREIHAAHTYRHRVAEILDAAGLGAAGSGAGAAGSWHAGALAEPPVSMILPTCRPEQITEALRQVARQRWRPLQLILVLHGLDIDTSLVEKRAREAGVDEIVVLAADSALTLGGCLNLGIEAADGAYIGKMDDDEVYGPHYVSDLIPAFSYTDAGVVGKLAHYSHLASIGATLLRLPEHEHRYVSYLRGGALLAEGDLMRTYRFADLGQGEDTDLFKRLRADGVLVYATDRFSFITIRHADPARHTWRPDDLELMANATLAFYGLPEEHILF